MPLARARPELQRLAAAAKMMEEHGDSIQARAQWLKALELLPSESTQTEWVLDKVHKLELAAPTAPLLKAPPNWVRKLGPLAPIALLLAKGKSLFVLFNLNFLLSLFAFVGVYRTVYGAKFGIGFAVLILIHEMGHFIDIKRRGLPADMPVFLPGFGAYVRWQALGVSQETRAAVSSCLLLSIFLKEPIFLLVVGGTAYRLFDKAMPTATSRFITGYFVAVLTLLGLVLWLVSMQIPGKP